MKIEKEWHMWPPSVKILLCTGNPVPPKTLNEAGQFSVCFSAAWDSKVGAYMYAYIRKVMKLGKL
jgi:predicted ribosome quality control (RQC) complex YloA/Tae2 family protein